GQVQSTENWSLLDSRGERCAVQAAPLDRWADRSIRWALVDFQANARAGEAAAYTLEVDGSDGAVAESPLEIDIHERSIAVRTGAATFHVAREGHFFFADVEVGERSAFGGPAVQILVKDPTGRDLIFGVNAAIVERSGALRAVVRTEGHLTLPNGAALLDVTARLNFYA